MTLGDYRGYELFLHASGPKPYSAAYSVWKRMAANAHVCVLQGADPGPFETDEEAFGAAGTMARAAINKLLDGN